jgi:Slp family outer membrane lipoprotein
MSARSCLALVPLLVALACARPPTALRGDYSQTSVPEAVANPDGAREVRWGGQLISTTTEADRTCFEVLERPLDGAARPRPVDDSSGRFIACSAGFYDPALWEPGREVTVVGTLDGTQTGKVGGAPYRYPVVEAGAVHLWPVVDPYESSWPAALSIGIGGGGGGLGGGIGLGF